MFRKPRYISDDLTQALQGLEKLHILRDKSEQASRLVSKDIYLPEFERYCQMIKSRQKLVLFMQEAMQK